MNRLKITLGSTVEPRKPALFRIISLTFMLAMQPTLLWAEWVQVTGRAPVETGLYEQARQHAREDAMQQAIMTFGTKVSSKQRMENGVLTQDQVSLSSQARVNRSVVQDEYIWKGMLHLLMNVEVDAVPVCPNSQANGYKKKVVVLGFSIQSPEQTRLGAIHNANRGLASALNRALQTQGSLVVFESSQYRLYDEVVNAPSRYLERKMLTKAANFAKQMGAQFVVSGVIRDMGVEDESAFNNSYWAKIRRFGRRANQKRRFSAELFVHDGFSGAIVWQRSFSVTANWTQDAQQTVGFGTPTFWANEYGQAVSGLVDKMAFMIDEQLKCQPFMTRISRIEGKTLHFSSGASSGIRPGDTLSLYRTSSFQDADMFKQVELANVKTALTVSQVHPGFSSGALTIDPGRLNIQEDDLLVAW